MNSNSSHKSDPSALSFMLQTWKLFYPYLSNRDIGKLDSALTEISLRKMFLTKVSDFYLVNKIYSKKELDWILTRNILWTKCHLAFDCQGMILTLTLITLWLHSLFTIILLIYRSSYLFDNSCEVSECK